MTTARTGNVAAESTNLITTDTLGLNTGDAMIATRDGDIPVYWARPANKSYPPILLVVQEIFGVHEHIKDVCRRFAKAGYLAVAPALYARQGDASAYTDIPTLIEKIVSKVPDAQVMADLDAGAAWAVKQGGDAGRISITGFCWGGRITWMYASHNPALKAGVAWYGGLIRPMTSLTPTHPIDIAATLSVPVLGLYGADDTGIPIETVEKMQAALIAAGSRSQIHLYPDTPHAFHADYRPSYRKTEAEDGWQRCIAWLAAHGAQ
jgi:carboxymethylenebutenolidase